MDLSLFFELETSDLSEAGVKRTFDQCVEQVMLADRLGYRAVWFTEHHFLPGFSYSSSPELVLAHLAAKTKNIRLGHGIVLLPFRINHPLRVAERIATLDLLSNGRVEFGGGRAISESELSGFEVDPDETRPQWEEALSILPKMWTQESFKYESRTLKIPERQVVPKPVQKPHPPMWVACTQPATLEFAGDHGLGVLGFGIGQGQSNSYVRTYRERIKNCRPFGASINDKFALLTFTLCCDTDEEALHSGAELQNVQRSGTQPVRALDRRQTPALLRIFHEALAGDYVHDAVGADVGNCQGRRCLHRQSRNLCKCPAVPFRCGGGRSPTVHAALYHSPRQDNAFHPTDRRPGNAQTQTQR